MGYRIKAQAFLFLGNGSPTFRVALHSKCFCHQKAWLAASSGNRFVSNPRPQTHPIRSKWLLQLHQHRLHRRSQPLLPIIDFPQGTAFPESQGLNKSFLRVLWDRTPPHAHIRRAGSLLHKLQLTLGYRWYPF